MNIIKIVRWVTQCHKPAFGGCFKSTQLIFGDFGDCTVLIFSCLTSKKGKFRTPKMEVLYHMGQDFVWIFP